MAVYVFDDARNKFEGMTREQIVNAIASATGHTPQEIDDEAVITAIQEKNAQRGVSLWVGTQNEYNAIQEPDENTLYIVTDAQETNELQNQINLLQQAVNELQSTIQQMEAGLANPRGTEVIWTYPQGATIADELESKAQFQKPITDYFNIIATVKTADMRADNYDPLCGYINVLCTKCEDGEGYIFKYVGSVICDVIVGTLQTECYITVCIYSTTEGETISSVSVFSGFDAQAPLQSDARTYKIRGLR